MKKVYQDIILLSLSEKYTYLKESAINLLHFSVVFLKFLFFSLRASSHPNYLRRLGRSQFTEKETLIRMDDDDWRLLFDCKRVALVSNGEFCWSSSNWESWEVIVCSTDRQSLIYGTRWSLGRIVTSLSSTQISLTKPSDLHFLSLCNGVFIQLNVDLILENDVRELCISVLRHKHSVW